MTLRYLRLSKVFLGWGCKAIGIILSTHRLRCTFSPLGSELGSRGGREPAACVAPWGGEGRRLGEITRERCLGPRLLGARQAAVVLPYVLCGAALQAEDVPSRGQRRDRRSGAVAELTEITELGNSGI